MSTDQANAYLRNEQGGVAVWAHRGGGFEGPANTLQTMRQSIERFPHMALELDLRPTADLASGSDDGVVVFHDKVLDHVTNGIGPTAEISYAEMQSLDPGYWWRPGAIYDHYASDYPLRGKATDDRLYAIPRLSDVLLAFPTTRLSLDLKADGMADKVAELLMRTGAHRNVVVQSFSDRRVQEFHKLAPQIATGPGLRRAIVAAVTPKLVRSAHGEGHVMVAPPHRVGPLRLNKAMVRSAHDAGLGVHTWTVNDVKSLDYVLSLGVDGVMTDMPSVIVPLVQEYNNALYA